MGIGHSHAKPTLKPSYAPYPERCMPCEKRAIAQLGTFGCPAHKLKLQQPKEPNFYQRIE